MKLLKGRMKRIGNVVLAFCLCLTMLATVVLPVRAASYNASAAVSYANSHWNDGVGLCAEFVSKCLAAGGVTIPNSASYYSSSTQSYNNNSGTLGIYTNPYTCSASLLLYLSKYYTVVTNPASSQIDIGDVVFMYSGEWRDGHVGIIINKNGGTPTYAAHNRATNTGKFYSNYPCTYVVKMNGVISSVTHTKDSSYGTNFTAYPKTQITAGNIFDAYHNQIDSTSWIGTSDKCTIHEVYTDGCCKVTYPLDAGGTKTVYSKISLFNTHTHSYTGSRYYESAHPHAITQRCVDYETCGGWIYTGEYYEKKSCEQCWYADFDIGASSVSVKVGESKTVSATVSGCLPDSAVLYREFSPDNNVVEVTIKNQQATFTGLKSGSTNLSLTVYSDSSKSHIIATITIPITVTNQTYTISYNANGGKGAPESQVKHHNTAIVLSSTKPTRTGYTFLGWAKGSTATSPDCMPGETYTTNGDVTLYAVWKKGCEGGAHKYVYSVTGRPTLTSTGKIVGECGYCGAMVSVLLPKLNADDYTCEVIKEAGCTSTGTGRYTWKETAYGGRYYFDAEISATGHNYANGNCVQCGERDPNYVYGDLTGDSVVNNEDVVLLLWNTLFPEDYPLSVSGDLTGDGNVNNEDVVLLLWHTLFPDEYPL